MSRFRFSGIHHAAFATSDMDKTVDYWRDLLGFKLVLALADSGEKQYAFQISGQMILFFFEWKAVEPVRPKRHGMPVSGPFIFDHLALNLESQEELEKLQDLLVCAEQPVSDLIDHGFIRSIYSFDPNGIPLEFNALVEGVDLIQNPVFADPNPGESAARGINPFPGIWPDCEAEDADDLRIVIEGNEKKLFR